MDNADACGQARHFTEDVARHEDGDALLLRQLDEQVADFDDPGRVQAVGGLVQHEQLGVVQQRLGQPQALLVAQRQRAGAPVGISAQTQPFDDVLHGFRLSARAQPAHGFQVLAHRELWIGIGCLHQVTDRGPRFLITEADALPQARRLRRRWA